MASGMSVADWARLLRCTECGERDADFVVSGAVALGRRRRRGSVFVLWTVRRLNRRRPAPLPIFRSDRPVSQNLRPSRAIACALPETGCHAQAAAILQPGSGIQQVAIVPQP